MPKLKVSKRELENRRYLVDEFMARGFTTPGKILNQKKMKPLYSIYKNPYVVVQRDIEAVLKYNKKKIENNDKLLEITKYRSRLEEIYRQGWIDYPNLSDNAKVRMMKLLFDISKDLARCSGVDPDNLDIQPMNVNVNNKTTVNNKNIYPPEEYLEALEEYNELFGIDEECDLEEKSQQERSLNESKIINDQLTKEKA